MIGALWSTAYRAAWLLALPPLRAGAAVGLFPAAWRARERIVPAPASGEDRPLWMHCASLGEAKGLWALAQSLPPDLPLLLTASTPSGIEWLEARCGGHPGGALRRAAPAPLDHPDVARRFLAATRARGLVLYESELWPHWIGACRGMELPVAMAAGRLGAAGLRTYRRFGNAPARLLSSFAWIQAQSAADADRFAALASAPVSVGFDFKAAHFLAPASRATESLPARPGYAFVSLHLPELRRLLPAVASLSDRGDVLVFPRRPEEFPAFLALLAPLGFAPRSRDAKARRMVVDGFGHVAALLPLCHTAFVGGSLVPKGCHNLWEPLAAGLRIRFGAHHGAQEPLASALLAAGLARIATDPSDLAGEPLPGPDVPGACAAFAESLRESLESALEECGKAIIATFFPQDPAPRAIAPAGAREGTAR